MKKSTLTAIVAAITVSAVGLTAVAPAFAYGKKGAAGHGPQFDFAKIDANADGKITREEMTSHRAAEFAANDTNGDGKLSKEEMVAAILNKASQRMEKRVEHMMVEKDTDDDGQISLAEMSEGKHADRMFNRLDKDGDGAVSEDEISAMKEGFWKKRRNQQGSE